MQAVLTPLAQLAHVRNIAVILVSHLRKKAGDAIHRTMGSLAFVSLARSAWTIVKDPDNANRRFFLPIKNNIATDTTGLAYTIEQAPHRNVPTMHWSPDPVTTTADMVFAASLPGGRPDDERQSAIEWLRDFLESGPVPTNEVKVAAEAHGFTYGTLRRAFRQLSCQAVHDGHSSRWLWQLREQDAQNPVGEFCASCILPSDEVAQMSEPAPVATPMPPTEPKPTASPLRPVITPKLPTVEDNTKIMEELLRKAEEESEKLTAGLFQSADLPISVSHLMPDT